MEAKEPMTLDEYNEKIKQASVDYKNNVSKICWEYAKGQIKFKTGDIIKNHRTTIKIDKIKWAKDLGVPYPVYIGFELKKDLTIRKDKSEAAIYGNQQVELIKSA